MLNDLILNANSIVILGHKNPDGDALGAVLAMGHICKNQFDKTPVLAFEGVIPDNLRFLPQGWWLKKADDIKDTVFDLAISIDTADTETLNDESARTILTNAKSRVKIDHHQNSKEIDGHNIIHQVAATCEIIANMAFDAGWTITHPIARALYAGIFTDTGGFVHDYMTAETTRVVARLLETGFDHTEVVRKLFEKTREIFSNNAETLARTLFTDDGKIGYTTFSIKKVNETDRPHRETEWLHKQIMVVREVEATVVFKEVLDGKIQVSIRGKRTPINKFAETFGGGGHLLAAGLALDCTMAEAVAQIIPKLNAYLNACEQI